MTPTRRISITPSNSSSFHCWEASDVWMFKHTMTIFESSTRVRCVLRGAGQVYSRTTDVPMKVNLYQSPNSPIKVHSTRVKINNVFDVLAPPTSGNFMQSFQWQQCVLFLSCRCQKTGRKTADLSNTTRPWNGARCARRWEAAWWLHTLGAQSTGTNGRTASAGQQNWILGADPPGNQASSGAAAHAGGIHQLTLCSP